MALAVSVVSERPNRVALLPLFGRNTVVRTHAELVPVPTEGRRWSVCQTCARTCGPAYGRIGSVLTDGLLLTVERIEEARWRTMCMRRRDIRYRR